jgi:hypothetical protein
MEQDLRYCLEANAVGEYPIPRCPEMELPPVEMYAGDAYASNANLSVEPNVYIETTGESDMAVTLLQKTKGKIVAKEKTDLDVKVERLITLKVQIDAVKSVLDEYEKLRKELASIADTVGASNEQVSFEVENGAVAFSPKSFERKISDMPKVFDLLGKENFLKLAKVTMTDLDKYLGTSEQESCVKKDLTGARKISVVPKEKVVTQA